MPANVPLLIVTGPVGVGKTTVAMMVSDLLEQAHISHAYVDLDALRWHYPRLPEDRFSIRLAMKNLTAVWLNYQAYGAKCLVVTDAIETLDDLDRYRASIPGADIFVIRLRASLDTLAQRVRQREIGSGLEWHLARAPVLAALMDENKVEDVLIETDNKPVVQVTEEVLAAWLQASTLRD
jgi:adenylylsulfate kinase-like enzyme